MRFFNITDHANPFLVANTSIPHNYIHGATLSDNLMYLWNTWNILIIDFSNNSNPVIMKNYYTMEYFPKLYSLLDFNNFDDNRMMLCYGNFNGLTWYNFSNLEQPIETSVYPYQIVPKDIEVKGDVLFTISNNKLEMYYVDNPEEPKAASVYVAKGIIYDCKIIDSAAFLAVGNKGLEIVNVSNPQKPVCIKHLDSFSINEFNSNTSNCLAVDYQNKIIYLSRDYSGIAVININDIANPSIIKEFIPNEYGAVRKILYDSEKLFVGTSGMDWSLGDFRVYDVTNPLSPKLLYGINGIDSAPEFYIEDNYLYLFIVNSFFELRIYDLTKEISASSYLSKITEFEFIKDIYVENNVLFVVHGFGLENKLTTINILNKKKPKMKCDYEGQLSVSSLVNVVIDKDILYINEGWNGIHIFRLENWNYQTVKINAYVLNSLIIIIPIVLIKKRRN